MDKNSPIQAETLVNLLEKGELDDIFGVLGGDSHFRAITKVLLAIAR